MLVEGLVERLPEGSYTLHPFHYSHIMTSTRCSHKVRRRKDHRPDHPQTNNCGNAQLDAISFLKNDLVPRAFGSQFATSRVSQRHDTCPVTPWRCRLTPTGHGRFLTSHIHTGSSLLYTALRRRLTPTGHGRFTPLTATDGAMWPLHASANHGDRRGITRVHMAPDCVNRQR